VQPSLVIIYFGGNDSIHPHPSGLGPHVPLEEYVENMRKIANYLKVINDFSPLLLQIFYLYIIFKKINSPYNFFLDCHDNLQYNLLVQSLTHKNYFQSLSDHIRLIFLTSPPISEVQIRKKLRFMQFLFE
jgi:hypothetical protein